MPESASSNSRCRKREIGRARIPGQTRLTERGVTESRRDSAIRERGDRKKRKSRKRKAKINRKEDRKVKVERRTKREWRITALVELG